jgi:hypothetical protein
MTPPTIACPACSASLPVAARFCVECGARVAPRQGAVSWQLAEPRYFGVLPGRRLLRSGRVRLARAWGVTAARLRLGREAGVAYTRAQLELGRLRREAAVLRAEHDRAVFALGDSVYRGAPEEVEQARAQLAGLDDRLVATERSMRRAAERMYERVELAACAAGRTVAVELPPEVPEPEPVPHEPPGPVIVPEPEPVPHEPPGPVIVPEPEPTTDTA